MIKRKGGAEKWHSGTWAKSCKRRDYNPTNGGISPVFWMRNMRLMQLA
jgi:hypothetical protein